MPSPPVIASCTLVPTHVTAGSPITVNVVWTGEPHTGVTYQWRLGRRRIKGARAASYTPLDVPADLNCLVHIDNGRGCATAISPYALTSAPEPEDPDEEERAFSSAFSSAFG